MSLTVEDALHQLQVDGWCVLQEAIPAGVVDEIRRRVEIAVEKHGQVDELRGIGARKGLIAFEQSFSSYLADPRILAIAETLLGPHYRISFTSAQINYPGNPRGNWHADWPFNQNNAGHVPAPYPMPSFTSLRSGCSPHLTGERGDFDHSRQSSFAKQSVRS